MENTLLKGLQETTTEIQTENGMKTYNTSLNGCLDLFSMIAALRHESDANRIIGLFSKAWNEDKLLALRILFWSRDAREGAGERKVFRTISKWLIENYPDDFTRFIKIVPEYGRWDDIFELPSMETMEVIKNGLDQKNGLLAKWLPRGKKFDNLANRLRKHLGLTPKEYRKLIVSLTKVIETQLCEKKWDEIIYKQVPSKAFQKYTRTFKRHDTDRFTLFIQKALKGETTINAKTVYPYEIIKNIWADEAAANAQWMNLPNWVKEGDSFFPVCDTSGSMTMTSSSPSPLDVSISLGIYLSERNKSAFKDAFIIFSEYPELQYLSGKLSERMRQFKEINASNTNLAAVFDLILKTAVDNKVKPEDMPKNILVISDMEFDKVSYGSGDKSLSQTAVEMIKTKYNIAGYETPGVIFWNVDSRHNNVTCRASEEGVAMVSGFSPSIMKNLFQGELSPVKVMLNTVHDKRYDLVESTWNEKV